MVVVVLGPWLFSISLILLQWKIKRAAHHRRRPTGAQLALANPTPPCFVISNVSPTPIQAKAGIKVQS